MSPERELSADVAGRANALFSEMRAGIFRRTDKLFAGLFVFQWLAGIVAALLLSPTTWRANKAKHTSTYGPRYFSVVRLR